MEAREVEWEEERQLRRRLSKKGVSEGPILTSCVFWERLGPSTSTFPYSVAQLRWREGVCLSATISNPIYLGDRKMVPSQSVSLFHFHLCLTPDVLTHPSLKLLFGQALNLWTPFL